MCACTFTSYFQAVDWQTSTASGCGGQQFLNGTSLSPNIRFAVSVTMDTITTGMVWDTFRFSNSTAGKPECDILYLSFKCLNHFILCCYDYLIHVPFYAPANRRMVEGALSVTPVRASVRPSLRPCVQNLVSAQ